MDPADLQQIYAMTGAPRIGRAFSDSALAARLARLEDMVPYQLRGNTFAAQNNNQFSPLDSSGVIDGRLNLTVSTAIDFQGSMAPTVIDGHFTVASPSDSSAVIYWDGTNSSRIIILRRSDGTATPIPGNTITITGLTNSLAYQALAFWAPNNACGLGWGTGDVGTPLIAFSPSASASLVDQGHAAQHLAGREEVGTIGWTQPGSGGTTPAGSPIDPPGRDPGTCVMVNTDIEPLGNIHPNDWCTRMHPEKNWIAIETDKMLRLNCTHDHPLYDSEQGKVRADFFTPGKWSLTEFGEQKIVRAEKFIRQCTKVSMHMNLGHLFWANGFLSHNFKPDLG